MKKCIKCEEELTNINCLYRSKTKKNMSSYCKKCFSEYTNERRIKLKKDAIDLLGGKCNDCMQEYTYQVYDFHHLDPKTKEFNWDYARRVSKTRMIEELKKCVLLCANCHRIRHSNE